MGGMGFIENNKVLCMMSVLTSTHVLEAARDAEVDRFFYASSACVYAADKQTAPHITALREQDAYPAMAEDGYGWEKLFSERMCRHFLEDFGEQTRSFMYIDDCVRGTQMIARRLAGPGQPRLIGAREHQPARRHRRADRAGEAAARVRPLCSTGSARPQQRQHADPADLRLGAVDQPA
jgi:nucleoside-diphosphate-sugar epimerase